MILHHQWSFSLNCVCKIICLSCISGMMRNHLVQCFSKGKLEQFPSEIVCALPVVNNLKLRLYCKCKMPELPNQEDMAYCPVCHNWYHKGCEDISDTVFKDKRLKFVCSKCTP